MPIGAGKVKAGGYCCFGSLSSESDGPRHCVANSGEGSMRGGFTESFARFGSSWIARCYHFIACMAGAHQSGLKRPK